MGYVLTLDVCFYLNLSFKTFEQRLELLALRGFFESKGKLHETEKTAHRGYCIQDHR